MNIYINLKFQRIVIEIGKGIGEKENFFLITESS